jgi:hypothetical protein
VVAGERWGMTEDQAWSIYYNLAKKGVVPKSERSPFYTDAEDAILRAWADRINHWYADFCALAKEVSKVGPIPRDNRSVNARFHLLGLRDKSCKKTRRERAEEKYFRPLKSRVERDCLFDLLNVYVVPDCVSQMFAELVNRMIDGNPPSITWKAGEKESDDVFQHQSA